MQSGAATSRLLEHSNGLEPEVADDLPDPRAVALWGADTNSPSALHAAPKVSALAAGVLSAQGIVLSPVLGAVVMSLSTISVAIDAPLLAPGSRRTQLDADRARRQITTRSGARVEKPKCLDIDGPISNPPPAARERASQWRRANGPGI